MSDFPVCISRNVYEATQEVLQMNVNQLTSFIRVCEEAARQSTGATCTQLLDSIEVMKDAREATTRMRGLLMIDTDVTPEMEELRIGEL